MLLAYLRVYARAVLRMPIDVAAVQMTTDRMYAQLTTMEGQMADVSSLLNEVAEGLRGPLSTSVTALIAENQQLRAANTELAGEDAAESTAAADVKAAFDDLASKFTAAPETPDVPPLPTPEPAPADETPTPADDGDVPA